MKKSSLFIVFIGIFLLIGKAGASTQDVIINEIGSSEPSGYEWMEIYNRGSSPIDLTGWKFVEDFSDTKSNGASHALNFSDAAAIAPGQYAIIAQDQNKFKEKYPNFTGLLIDSSWSSLNESGEKIGLKDSSENFSELFTYLSAKNYSLERKDFNLNDYTSANWQEHPSGNTIGAQNSNYQLTTENQQITNTTNNQGSIASNPQTSNFQPLTLNLIANAGTDIIAVTNQEITLDASQSQGAQNYEWNFGDGLTSKEKIAKHSYNFPGKYIVTLTVSNGSSLSQTQITATIYPAGVYINELLPSPQGSDSENEWIEIFNSNNFSVNLSDWILADNSKKFTIPQNTFIAPQSYLTLMRKITKISLGNSTGSLKFYYPENILINEINYEKAKEGFSASRKQDGNFVWTKNSTPSGPNIFSSDVNSVKNSGSLSPQSVTENTANIKNNIINNKTAITSENFIAKNFIGVALAQTVGEEAIADNPKSEKSDVNTQNTKNQNQETQANIGGLITSGNIFIKLFIVLAMGGIFALMWRMIKNRS